MLSSSLSKYAPVGMLCFKDIIVRLAHAVIGSSTDCFMRTRALASSAV